MKDELAALISKGDQARDAGDQLAAAGYYRQALVIAPGRTDIRVQLGNMLKDSLCFAEAEAAYRHALSERPDDGDIQLQLGHLYKMQGKRAEAIAAYERALLSPPQKVHASNELVRLGVSQHQTMAFADRLRANQLDLVPVIADEIARMRGLLDQIASILPDIRTQTAFPVALYQTYRDLYEVPAPAEAPSEVHFSIVVLADREPLPVLHRLIRSAVEQTYPNFTLHAVGQDPVRRGIFERVAPADRRIVWSGIEAGQSLADAERDAIAQAQGDWIVVLAPGATLHRHALAWFADAASLGATACVCDEEILLDGADGRQTLEPVLRHTVDYDTLLENNVYGETVAVKCQAYRSSSSYKNLRSSSPDGDSANKMTSLAAARAALLLDLAFAGPVAHIPLPLVRRASGAAEPYSAADQEAAAKAHIEAAGLGGKVAVTAGGSGGALPLPAVWRARAPHEAITVIIPTRDNTADLAALIDSMRKRAERPQQLRFSVVDNGSVSEAAQAYFSRVSKEADVAVRRIDEPFNWSRLNNSAVSEASSPLIVFANDDMLMLSSGWDEKLRGLLAREEVGAVGAKLLYPDDTIQHAGVLFDWKGSTIHDGLYEPRNAPGPASRWTTTRNVSAVTGAFLATRRETFLRAGGFDEVFLPVSYSDIDYALKLRAGGLKILWTPQIELYHYELKSRGLDHLDAERQARGNAEFLVLRDRWGAALDFERTLNPIWVQATLPFKLIAPASQARVQEYVRRTLGPPGSGIVADNTGLRES